MSWNTPPIAVSPPVACWRRWPCRNPASVEIGAPRRFGGTTTVAENAISVAVVGGVFLLGVYRAAQAKQGKRPGRGAAAAALIPGPP